MSETTTKAQPITAIVVNRAEIKKMHDYHIAQIHQLRRLLGLPPLPTGKQQRKQQHLSTGSR